MRGIADRHALVDLLGISKHFGQGETRVDALADVSLSVFAGEVVGLVGPSGSGKTTLLNVIGCVTEPSSGRISLDGEIVYDQRWLRGDLRRLRLEKIGFIFQIYNLLPFLTSIENVMEVMELAGASSTQARNRAADLLDYLEVAHRKNAMPSRYPAVKRSASPSPERSPITRASSLPTSQQLRSIPCAPELSWTCCAGLRLTRRRRSSS